MRSRCTVVSFGDFRALALLADQLLLRAKAVREDPVEFQISFKSASSAGLSYRRWPASSRTRAQFVCST